MITYCDTPKKDGTYKNILIIDNYIYKYNKKKNMIQKVEEDFDVTGVRHWLDDLKLPIIYNSRFKYIEYNSQVVHDINNKTYNFSITVDDKVFYDDFKYNLIEKVEKELGIQGIIKWYENMEVPFKYHNTFRLVKLDDIEIYNRDNRKYKFTISIDGKEFKSNHKLSLIDELINKHNYKNADLWFDTLRLSKRDTELYKEVIINGTIIHPRKVRGFI